MHNIDVRPVAEDGIDAWAEVVWHAFGTSPGPRQREQELATLEPERAIAAYVAGDLAGSAAIFTFTMTVPGGPRPVAGVTSVGVLPTYRRRGVLSALMRSQLHGLHAEGREPVAALWASEPAIYGRFGYGAASRRLKLTVPRGQDALVGAPVGDALRLRLVDTAASGEVVRDCYESVARQRPGMFLRNDVWERSAVADLDSLRQGASALRTVVAEDADGVRGYVRYATVERWTDEVADGTVRLRELEAVDPAAYAALWRYVLDLDLMARVVSTNRPEDDTVLELLRDLRAAKPTLRDALFCRLVDVDRGLATRTYAGPFDVVLEVRDELCPWNARRWRLCGDSSGAVCSPTSDAADISLGVLELGSVYLGGNSLRRLAAAGRVEERRPGAVGQASTAFRSDPAPWCQVVF